MKKIKLIKNRFLKKVILLVLVLLMFSPDLSSAVTCVEAGGSCEASCPLGTLPAVTDPCPSGENCCSPTATASPDTEVEYNEGSSGFMFLKGHIVPCGRSKDDPGTNEDETMECTLCHLFLMLKRVADLIFSLMIIAAILFITIGGVIYIVSTGNSNLTGLAKSIIKKTLTGFALMIVGWSIVYTLLVFLSANDMIGEKESGGTWYQFTCDMDSNF